MTFSFLSYTAVNQKILHEQEVEKTFLELLSSDDSGVIVSGCGGLLAMSSLHSSRQLIGCEGGLAKLVESAQSEVGEVRAAAARTIATLISGAPANQKLVNTKLGGRILNIASVMIATMEHNNYVCYNVYAIRIGCGVLMSDIKICNVIRMNIHYDQL